MNPKSTTIVRENSNSSRLPQTEAQPVEPTSTFQGHPQESIHRVEGVQYTYNCELNSVLKEVRQNRERKNRKM